MSISASEKHEIMVVHASVGSGHLTAARAVVEALEQIKCSGLKLFHEQPDDFEINLVDIFDFARHEIDTVALASGFTGPTKEFYDVTWRYGLTGRLVWNGSTIWLHAMFPKFKSYIERHRPAAVICTHITAANVVIGARILTGQHYPIVCVPTDYEAEGFWPRRYVDLYCTASEYMSDTLHARGVESSRILETGIPVKPDYSYEYDSDSMRNAFGLPIDKKVALVLAGASLAQPYKPMRKILDEFMPRFKEFQDMEFVFLSGTDEEYRLRIENAIKVFSLNNVRVLGYVNDMPKLMSACDFTITKAGGLSSTECLDAQLPMLLVGRSYGQEKCNVRMLMGKNAALRAVNAEELHSCLTSIRDDDKLLSEITKNAADLKKPFAAIDIATATLALAFDPAHSPITWRRSFMLGIGGKPAHKR